MRGPLSPPSASRAGLYGPDEWQPVLAAAYRSIDALEDDVGRSPEVTHALVSLLSRFEQPSAVEKAFAIAKEMLLLGAEEGGPAAVGSATVGPRTWSCLLHASMLCDTPERHSAVLDEVETLVGAEESDRKEVVTAETGVAVATGESASTLDEEVALLRTRLFSHARLCRGLKVTSFCFLVELN